MDVADLLIVQASRDGYNLTFDIGYENGIESIEDVNSRNGTFCTTELVLEYSGFGNTSESSSPVYLCAT